MRTLVGAAGICAAVGTGLLMLATVLDVTLRTVHSGGIPGVVEFSEILLVAVVFLGMGFAQLRDQHPAFTLLMDRAPARVREPVALVGELVSVITLGWLVWATAEAAYQSVLEQEYRFGVLRVPVWPARILIPLGMALLLLCLLADMRRRIRVLRTPGPKAESR